MFELGSAQSRGEARVLDYSPVVGLAAVGTACSAYRLDDLYMRVHHSSSDNELIIARRSVRWSHRHRRCSSS
jgi:hypothetical protein